MASSTGRMPLASSRCSTRVNPYVVQNHNSPCGFALKATTLSRRRLIERSSIASNRFRLRVMFILATPRRRRVNVYKTGRTPEGPINNPAHVWELRRYGQGTPEAKELKRRIVLGS